uniref:BTB domain-containing protein n=1 Tax=Caenorhabditis tropicalis TaxID=1561998 RepID=A0A1I7UKV1_9PELO
MRFRHKYAINGVHLFENAREHMERNDFPEIPIGTIGGVDGWYLTMQRKIINNKVYYHSIIYTNERRKVLKYRMYSNFLENDGSSGIPYKNSSYLKPKFGPNGKRGTVDGLLNEERGYLTNGGITIEYGFQIEGILSSDNIWTFNFHDPLFDCQKKLNMISFHKDSEEDGLKFFHCHKQLLTHHSTYFDSNSKENQMIKLTDKNVTRFNEFLQLSHGVREDWTLSTFYQALIYAQRYDLPNVIQLLDQFIVLDELDPEKYLQQAISYDLRHFLADFLKDQKTWKELAEKLKKVDLETMIGEAMKKCVKRFLEF